MSPYEGGEEFYKLAGYIGWDLENFVVFTAGLLLAANSSLDPTDQVNWAWGFLASHNHYKTWKKQQDQKNNPLQQWKEAQSGRENSPDNKQA